ELIPMDDNLSDPGDGGDPATEGPSPDDQYFAAIVPGATDGGNAWIWGVRDEPVPITYRHGFPLPAGITGINFQDVGFLGGRLTFWFTTPDSLYYSTFSDGGWDAYRLIEIGSQTAASDARLLLIELNKSSSAEGL